MAVDQYQNQYTVAINLKYDFIFARFKSTCVLKNNLKPKGPRVQYQVIIVHRIQQTHFHKGHKTTIYTLFFSVKVYLKVYLKKKRSYYLENFPKSFPIACAQFMEFIKPELISKLYM